MVDFATIDLVCPGPGALRPSGQVPSWPVSVNPILLAQNCSKPLSDSQTNPSFPMGISHPLIKISYNLWQHEHLDLLRHLLHPTHRFILKETVWSPWFAQTTLFWDQDGKLETYLICHQHHVDNMGKLEPIDRSHCQLGHTFNFFISSKSLELFELLQTRWWSIECDIIT